MSSENFIPSPGQPFNIAAHKVRDSVKTTWTTLGSTPDRAIEVRGVYWSSIVSGSTLQIRDREEDNWYYYEANETSGLLRTPVIDYLTLPVPVFTQFEYYDSTGSNTLIVYGIYM